jgi:hypothetical protein
MAEDELPAQPGGSAARAWAIFLGTTAAVATATFVVAWRIRRSRAAPTLADVSDIIQDCFDRVRQIEADLHRTRHSAESLP